MGKRQRQRQRQRQIRWGRDKGKYKDRDKKEDRETERRRGETAIVKNMSTFQVIQFETKLAEITIPASKMRDGENRFFFLMSDDYIFSSTKRFPSDETCPVLESMYIFLSMSCS